MLLETVAVKAWQRWRHPTQPSPLQPPCLPHLAFPKGLGQKTENNLPLPLGLCHPAANWQFLSTQPDKFLCFHKAREKQKASPYQELVQNWNWKGGGGWREGEGAVAICKNLLDYNHSATTLCDMTGDSYFCILTMTCVSSWYDFCSWLVVSSHEEPTNPLPGNDWCESALSFSLSYNCWRWWGFVLMWASLSPYLYMMIMMMILVTVNL